MFNVENPTLYHTPINYLAIITNPYFSSSTSPQPFPVHPPSLTSRRYPIEKIENILEDEIILTTVRGYQQNLVCWCGSLNQTAVGYAPNGSYSSIKFT